MDILNNVLSITYSTITVTIHLVQNIKEIKDINYDEIDYFIKEQF